MKIILLTHIEKLGRKGEVVTVKRGFARNYLIPRNLALYATPQNMKSLGSLQAKAAEEEERMLAELKKLDEKIRSLSLTFIRKVDENEHMFGSVSESDISHQLTELGVNVHKSMIVLDKHIKTLGEISVPVKLHKDIVSEIKVMVESEQKEAPAEEAEVVEAAPEPEIASPETEQAVDSEESTSEDEI